MLDVIANPVTERHFSPEELGTLWNLSGDTVRRLFASEPGVLVVARAKNGKRRYRTLRIPESVAARVHRRMASGGEADGPCRKGGR